LSHASVPSMFWIRNDVYHFYSQPTGRTSHIIISWSPLTPRCTK
jgi:hypothetical protein